MKKYFLLLTFVLISNQAVASDNYALDRVYTANQVSNTVSVINPKTDTLLGEIVLGSPQPNVLTALYTGQSLVHGLGYSPIHQILATVSVGSNSVALIDTTTNKVNKIIYIGRAPHEATFRPNSNEFWVTVRGEDYLSVIDILSQKEIKQIKVSNGPGMVAFTPDGKFAYNCSSFTPNLEVIDTNNYEIIKTLTVASPFCPNIFASPDGKLIAFTHKDIGKVSVLDTHTNEVIKTFDTGKITNHVTFTELNGKKLMAVTVGGENIVKIFNVSDDYKLINTIKVGTLPHGGWISPDGKKLYVGLEYDDKIQAIDLEKMQIIATIDIGQSPQALLYAKNAVNTADSQTNLALLKNNTPTQVVVLQNTNSKAIASGQLSIRSIGLTDLIEQLFLNLDANSNYVLALSKTDKKPQADYVINSFTTNDKGKFAGQSTGLVKSLNTKDKPYKKVILLNQTTGNIVMESNL